MRMCALLLFFKWQANDLLMAILNHAFWSFQAGMSHRGVGIILALEVPFPSLTALVCLSSVRWHTFIISINSYKLLQLQIITGINELEKFCCFFIWTIGNSVNYMQNVWNPPTWNSSFFQQNTYSLSSSEWSAVYKQSGKWQSGWHQSFELLQAHQKILI